MCKWREAAAGGATLEGNGLGIEWLRESPPAARRPLPRYPLPATRWSPQMHPPLVGRMLLRALARQQ